MHVTNIHPTYGAQRVRLDAEIHVESGGKRYHVFFDVPHRFVLDLVARAGDPFLALCLLPAMKLGEDLIVEAPVSARLYDSLAHIQSAFSFMHDVQRVEVSAPLHRKGRGLVPFRPKRGLFFSLGVDSFYSLKRLLDNRDTMPLTHLIVVHGFDIFYKRKNHILFNEVHRRCQQVADHYGLELLDVVTNQRDFSDRYMNWKVQYGNGTMAVGLALQRGFERFYFAAGLWMFYDGLLPYGSGHLLTPYWGTERVFFQHHGGELKRREKIEEISRMPLAMEHLRVCWENPDNAYNCGKCEKCLRTMIALYVLGKLEDCSSLPNEIDLEDVRTLRINNPTVLPSYRTLICDLEAMEGKTRFADQLIEILKDRVSSFRESRS